MNDQPDKIVGTSEYIAAICKALSERTLFGAVMEENLTLRRLLWAAHPSEIKYGDDGELQSDGIDFLRMPAQEIELRILERSRRKLLEFNRKVAEIVNSNTV